MVQQPDGKLVVAGTSISPFGNIRFILLVRYLSDGRVDGSFGPGGKVITSVGSGSEANALIQQPDGKLVVAGFSSTSTMEAPRDVLLARYHLDGQLDPTFGVGGVVTTDFGADEGATALIQQPDGKLVVAGSSRPATGGSANVLLVRYHSDGQLDPTFGVGGVVTTDFGADEGVTALIEQPDGKLVVAGQSGIVRPQNTILARYHPDGRLDESSAWGVRSASSAHGPSISALLLQADGKLVVTGSRFNPFTPSNLLSPASSPMGIWIPPLVRRGRSSSSKVRAPVPRLVLVKPSSSSRMGSWRGRLS